MQEIGFNEHYGLQTAVLKRKKTMTRRLEMGFELLTETNHRFEDGVVKYFFEGSYHPSIIKPRYQIGEVVAVRQAYKELVDNSYFLDQLAADGKWLGFVKDEAGWNNKMFVKAYLMPHHICITDIKVERLQDISELDCLCEGVYYYNCGIDSGYTFDRARHKFGTAQKAFADLIDKVSGKGTWDRNLFMPAYTFELID